MAKPSKGPVTDISIILLSILLGFLLWIIIRHQDTEISTIPVRIRLENVPPYIEITKFEPKQVLVLFSFRRADELMIGQTDRFTARVDLSDIAKEDFGYTSVETRTINLRDDLVQAPDEVRLIRFKSTRDVTIEAKMRVLRARVEPQFVNSVPLADYFTDFENVIIEPQFVDVAVSEDRLKFQSAQQLVIQTAPIDLSNRTTSINEPFALRYDETQGVFKIPEVGQASVAVTLEITPRTETVTFNTVPVYVEAIEGISDVRSTPRTVSVTVRGPVSIIRRLTKEQLLVKPRESLVDVAKNGISSLEVGLQASYSLDDANMAQNLSSTLSSSSALLEFIPAVPEGPMQDELLDLLPPLLNTQDEDQPSTSSRLLMNSKPATPKPEQSTTSTVTTTK